MAMKDQDVGHRGMVTSGHTITQQRGKANGLCPATPVIRGRGRGEGTALSLHVNLRRHFGGEMPQATGVASPPQCPPSPARRHLRVTHLAASQFFRPEQPGPDE
ncbi:hypothetical protein EYF80_034966 [Liparis tanakae]|uniref:Uncharacterized protein n=1 Tax=Liparis tanakae TaxID=230148 RepID=A0A4Z2GMR4_9TELE|nr:hypothetical protein EYF80_034966 [Liparis tanakae]